MAQLRVIRGALALLPMATNKATNKVHMTWNFKIYMLENKKPSGWCNVELEVTLTKLETILFL